MNKYKAKIDISKNIEAYFDVPLFTGDLGNSVELSFFVRGEPYNMTGVTVSAKRADGQTVFDMGSISGNTAVYTFANNMHNTPGNLDVQISLTDSTGAFLTSGFLHFSVEKGYAEDSGIEADDRYPIFNSFSEELSKKANLSGGNKFLGKQTIYHTNSDGAVIDIISESTMPDTVISLSDYDSGETLKVERNGQIWKGDKKYVTETELASKVDAYEAKIWGDLYVMQGARIENVDNNTKPGLEVNHYPTTGEEQPPTVLYKYQNVETARMDHTGQLWKGDKKYVTETELEAKADLSDVLTKTNTTPYTPTENYHPSTKKYVDDVAKNFIGEATMLGGAYAGPESMAADLPPLGVLFVTEEEPQLEAVVYDNLTFAADEPTKGENWAQLESETVQNAALGTAKSGITFENGRLTVSKAVPEDTTFWNKL